MVYGTTGAGYSCSRPQGRLLSSDLDGVLKGWHGPPKPCFDPPCLISSFRFRTTFAIYATWRFDTYYNPMECLGLNICIYHPIHQFSLPFFTSPLTNSFCPRKRPLLFTPRFFLSPKRHHAILLHGKLSLMRRSVHHGKGGAQLHFLFTSATEVIRAPEARVLFALGPGASPKPRFPPGFR